MKHVQLKESYLAVVEFPFDFVGVRLITCSGKFCSLPTTAGHVCWSFLPYIALAICKNVPVGHAMLSSPYSHVVDDISDGPITQIRENAKKTINYVYFVRYTKRAQRIVLRIGCDKSCIYF